MIDRRPPSSPTCCGVSPLSVRAVCYRPVTSRSRSPRAAGRGALWALVLARAEIRRPIRSDPISRHNPNALTHTHPHTRPHSLIIMSTLQVSNRRTAKISCAAHGHSQPRADRRTIRLPPLSVRSARRDTQTDERQGHGPGRMTGGLMGGRLAAAVDRADLEATAAIELEQPPLPAAHVRQRRQLRLRRSLRRRCSTQLGGGDCTVNDRALTALRLPAALSLSLSLPSPRSPQIYGMGGSTCTQRVLITAFENEAPFEIKVCTHTHTRSDRGARSQAGWQCDRAERRAVLSRQQRRLSSQPQPLPSR